MQAEYPLYRGDLSSNSDFVIYELGYFLFFVAIGTLVGGQQEALARAQLGCHLLDSHSGYAGVAAHGSSSSSRREIPRFTP